MWKRSACLKHILLENGMWYNPLDKKGLDSKRISIITEDNRKGLWVGTYNGLYFFNREKLKFERKDNNSDISLPSVIILSILFLILDRIMKLFY